MPRRISRGALIEPQTVYQHGSRWIKPSFSPGNTGRPVGARPVKDRGRSRSGPADVRSRCETTA